MSGTQEKQYPHENKDLRAFREWIEQHRIPVESAHLALMGLTVEPTMRFAQEIMKGLPYSSLEHLQRNTGLPRQEMARLVHVKLRTLDRRRQEGRLEPDESDRAARLSRIFASALELFEYDVEATREWMSKERHALGGVTPWQMAETEPGAREVEALIGRLEHGVFS